MTTPKDREDLIDVIMHELLHAGLDHYNGSDRRRIAEWLLSALSKAGLRLVPLRALQPLIVFLCMVEAEHKLTEDKTLPNETPLLHFMGCGASHIVTVGDIRAICRSPYFHLGRDGVND